MSAMQRNKGATFERRVAKELGLLLGVSLRRNLRQTQESGLGDLVTDDAAWPFSVECKHANTAKHPEWRRQTVASAEADGKIPCLIWRITGSPSIRASLPMSVIGGPEGEWFDMDLEGFAYMAREIMAGGWT